MIALRSLVTNSCLSVELGAVAMEDIMEFMALELLVIKRAFLGYLHLTYILQIKGICLGLTISNS